MKYKKRDGGYFIRFDKGDDTTALLAQFAKSERVPAGVFTGIGAASLLTLGFYDLDKKEYYWTEHNGTYEVLGITGNVSWVGEEPVVHIHGTFAGEDEKAFGGHVKRLIVGGTLEIVLTIFSRKLEREKDDTTGLHLWKIP